MHHHRRCRTVLTTAVRSARRPGQTVPVELVPKEAGEFAFGCPTGMFRGNLIVE